MSKSLIITEKPSVARDITEALGGFESKDDGAYFESKDLVCTFAVGHILTLLEPEDISPNYKRWRLQDLPIVPEEFMMKPSPGQEQRINVISKLIKRSDVDALINACDAAREGELIFREIVKFTKSSKPIKRLWLQSMTKTAIVDGFAKLKDGKDYEGLAAAAECRAYSDWLIGMNATRALTVRLKSRAQRGASWSAGRVQTPTLALLVERELKVLEHVPQPYFRLHGIFAAAQHEYPGTWFDPNFKKSPELPEHREDRVFSKEFVDEVLAKVKDASGSVSETRKPKSRNAPLLFDLTSAQKEANRRFSWSAKRTLAAAQRCYEKHKVLTYPRTSSRVLPEDYRQEVDKIVDSFASHAAYGEHAQYLQTKGRLNEKKIFNDAGVSDHFAIIPTGVFARLDGDDAKFFDLVTRTFLAAFYPPAVYEEVERLTVVNEQHFRTKPPPILKDPGYLAVFEREKEEGDLKMPPLVAGQSEAKGIDSKNKSIEIEESETKPPGRIGEAGLLGMMENAGRQVDDDELASALHRAEGLGTAATRADIIENLKYKEYVDSGLRPTVKGIRLIDVLQRIKAESLTSAELTAQLELHLWEVEGGKRSAREYMEEAAEITRSVVEAARDFDFSDIYPDVDTLGECPKCQRPVFERAWFYGCTESTKREGPKECDFLVWKEFYGRYIDRQTVKILMTTGETRELDGFRDPNGQMYKAVIALENGQVVRKSSSQILPEGVTIEVNEDPLAPCPVHEGSDCKVVETQTDFVCTTLKAGREAGDRSIAGFGFPRVLCKREMKRDEVIEFITKGETQMLQKFISKRGRPFSAKLVIQKAGRFNFEFPERKPKEPKDPSEAKQPAKKAKKKSASKKTAKSKKAIANEEATT